MILLRLRPHELAARVPTSAICSRPKILGQKRDWYVSPNTQRNGAIYFKRMISISNQVLRPMKQLLNSDNGGKTTKQQCGDVLTKQRRQDKSNGLRQDN